LQVREGVEDSSKRCQSICRSVAALCCGLRDEMSRLRRYAIADTYGHLHSYRGHCLLPSGSLVCPPCVEGAAWQEYDSLVGLLGVGM
jgi:hypothetical protein